VDGESNTGTDLVGRAARREGCRTPRLAGPARRQEAGSRTLHVEAGSAATRRTTRGQGRDAARWGRARELHAALLGRPRRQSSRER
jgi:hypothetical protein